MRNEEDGVDAITVEMDDSIADDNSEADDGADARHSFVVAAGLVVVDRAVCIETNGVSKATGPPTLNAEQRTREDSVNTEQQTAAAAATAARTERRQQPDGTGAVRFLLLLSLIRLTSDICL